MPMTKRRENPERKAQLIDRDEALRRGYNLPPGVDVVEVNEERLSMFGPDDEWLAGGDTPALLRGGITFEAVRPREEIENSN